MSDNQYDSTSTKVSITKLTGQETFEIWQIQLEAKLKSKGVWRYVTGDKQPPPRTIAQAATGAALSGSSSTTFRSRAELRALTRAIGDGADGDGECLQERTNSRHVRILRVHEERLLFPRL
ncbi:hypothetical protein LTR56_023065 [Elasticomyces elasticus]|nr:hypothetical protein LTR56_023065 [Elasticomyces elasticus]KAK3623342.1 hypothetical protein LTR22_024421 [Elasticomyces elasticus]KAK4907296.1 hypothetical protein LTR49_023666 [Elasticomyces elasticus]KAK5747774.1 hypothetical protein LTS12_022173 [Elasticomyces elasticus]